MHCIGCRVGSMVQGMTRHWNPNLRRFSAGTLIFGVVMMTVARGCIAAEPPAPAVSAFNSYIAGVESRLAGQHRMHAGFLARAGSAAQVEMRLRRGELIVERIQQGSGGELQGAMLHHWRGT